MLDNKTTMELIKKAQNGDNNAKQDLLVNNLPLVKSIARRYRNKQIEYDDLMQLGSLGFIKAISHFDTSYNVQFSTYAVPMIAGEIKRFIRDDGSVKVSRMLKTLNSKIQQYICEYSQEFSRTPSIEEISKKFDIDPQEVVFTMDSNKFPVSLSDKYDDDSQSVVEKLPSKENQEDLVTSIMLKEIIQKLPDREKSIIILRYYRDKTQSEIAKIMGISQVQISRIESKVLAMLKTELA